MKNINDINKRMINRINQLRDYAYSTQNAREREKRLAKVDGYHDAYVDMVFELGLQEVFFKENVV